VEILTLLARAVKHMLTDKLNHALESRDMEGSLREKSGQSGQYKSIDITTEIRDHWLYRVSEGCRVTLSCMEPRRDRDKGP
jgi:hypothetical protein